MTHANGTAQSAYGFTGEMADVSGLTYLRARYYSPLDGRFMSRDTWEGNDNRPLSLNRWMYVEGNPVNLVDPSGNSPETTSQVLSQALAQYSKSSNAVNVLSIVNNCLPPSGIQGIQYDLTGYLALAMSKHGQDSRIKGIAQTLDLAASLSIISPVISAGMFADSYLKFNDLEGKGKEWDIKLKIQKELKDGIVLCGMGYYLLIDAYDHCGWFDHSTPGNIHFGYVAGLAKINHLVAAVLGGALEEYERIFEKGLPWENYCPPSSWQMVCDNPQDQAAVDFGYRLSQDPKYKNGITEAELRFELVINGELARFQGPPQGFLPPDLAFRQPNSYDADHFNQ